MAPALRPAPQSIYFVILVSDLIRVSGFVILSFLLLSWHLLILLAVFLIGVTKSGFGSGAGLMIVPMTAIAAAHLPGHDPSRALGLLLPLLILGDLLALYQYRELLLPNSQIENQKSKILSRLLPGSLVGLLIGAGLLAYFHHQTPRMLGALIRIEIGLESILLVCLYWWRQYRGTQHHLLPEPWRSHLTGAFAAASSTLAHAAGPIVATYLLPLNLDRQVFVATCAVYFFLLNTAKLPAYYAAGIFAHLSLVATLLYAPLVIAGALVGLQLNRRLSNQSFIRLTYQITFLLGLYMLYEGTMSLLQ